MHICNDYAHDNRGGLYDDLVLCFRYGGRYNELMTIVLGVFSLEKTK